jgi:hypothetical protein
MRDDPLPVEAVRDLLGITRAAYRAERSAGAAPERLATLAEIGEHFRVALDLASRTEPGSLGMCAAWKRAQKATEALCALIGEGTLAAPLVRAAAERVRKP